MDSGIATPGLERDRVILELRTLMLANSKELERAGKRITSRVNEQIRQAQARVRASVQEELDRHETARQVALGQRPRPTRPKQRKGRPYEPLKVFHYDLLCEWIDYYEARSERVRELAELSTPQAYARMLEEQLNARESEDRAERALYKRIVADTEKNLSVEARAERIAIPGNFLAQHIRKTAEKPLRSPRLNDWRDIALLALAACDFGTPFKRLCIGLEVDDSRSQAPVRDVRAALNHRTALLAAASLDDSGGKDFLGEARRKAWWRRVQQAHLHLTAASTARRPAATRRLVRGGSTRSAERSPIEEGDPRDDLRWATEIHRQIICCLFQLPERPGTPYAKVKYLRSVLGDLVRAGGIVHQMSDLRRWGYTKAKRGPRGGVQLTKKGVDAARRLLGD